jgi:hypothetical protein
VANLPNCEVAPAPSVRPPPLPHVRQQTAPPLPEGYWRQLALERAETIASLQGTVAVMRAMIDALSAELQCAIDALPKRRLEAYIRAREARGGPTP